jgi:hypothetical protein
MDKQLLQTRLSIVMLRDQLTFLNSFNEFQVLLKKHFKYEYTLDEIETGLHQLEESYMLNEAKENEIISSMANVEIEEDEFNY